MLTLVVVPTLYTYAVDALLAADPAPPLTETAIVSYFAEHVAEFRLPERVELVIVRTGATRVTKLPPSA